jgi:hypothetical protein
MLRTRFPTRLVAAIDQAHYLRIRAGTGDHRFIGIWAVVVDGRVFVRSWTLKPHGWNRTFSKEPRGEIEVDGRTIRVRARRATSERLQSAVDDAYREKYNTKASVEYVRGLSRGRRRESTIELLPG